MIHLLHLKGVFFNLKLEFPSRDWYRKGSTRARVGAFWKASLLSSPTSTHSQPAVLFTFTSLVVLPRHGCSESSEPESRGGQGPGCSGGQHQRRPGSPGRAEK